MAQSDIDRVQEFRKCIECFLCQDVRHVLREHSKHRIHWPAFLGLSGRIEMHPLDTDGSAVELKLDLRHRLLQHYQMLHECLPRRNQDHGQRDHSVEGTRRG